MNNDIYEQTERLKDTLAMPDINTVSSIEKYFTYKEHEYAITFYKVTENDGVTFFWTCNPFHIKKVEKNWSLNR